MSKFEETQWTDTDFSRQYRDESDIYLPFRHRIIETAIGYYKHFVAPITEARVLDLGCGDGLFIEQLLKSEAPAEVLLVDGSAEMLKAAKERLSRHGIVDFMRANFQELLTDDPVTRTFDFIFSSLAIHHLSLAEKKSLYSYIYRHLSHGGHFVHYDVVLAPSEKLEAWYLALWHQWISEYPDAAAREPLLSVPQRYKENRDNIPDLLETQLEALREAGFTNVDCYFKYGIFSLFGGCKG